MEGDRCVSGTERLQHLLVVEDNPGDTRLIEEAVADAEFDPTVHTVTTGKAALEYLRQHGSDADAPRPDVVLLDYSLPRMSGSEVLRELDDDFPETPVVLMTGSEPRKADLESDEARADAYLKKPADPEGYLEVIRSVVS